MILYLNHKEKFKNSLKSGKIWTICFSDTGLKPTGFFYSFSLIGGSKSSDNNFSEHFKIERERERERERQRETEREREGER